jgi:hypothetical protein
MAQDGPDAFQAGDAQEPMYKPLPKSHRFRTMSPLPLEHRLSLARR